MWVVGVLGVASGAALLIYVPSLGAVSRSILLFAGFHLVGAAVIGLSAYMTWGPKRSGSGRGLVFGREPRWLNPSLLAGLIGGAATVALQAAFPAYWPLALLLAAMAVVLFQGSAVQAGFSAPARAVLPRGELGLGASSHLLDLGCGAGRATYALVRGGALGRITALDDFGSEARRSQLVRNLGWMGAADRAEVISAPLTILPFASASFDAVVSMNVLDHRGGPAERALSEVFRILKPGGRLLLVVRVRGWTMFSVIGPFCLLLRSPSVWRDRAMAADFRLIDEGGLNGARFLLLEKTG